MPESAQLSRLWDEWLRAAGAGRATLAAEQREMYLALSDRQAATEPPLTAYPDCAACQGTLAEIARLTDQLRAHQQLPGHVPAAGRQ